MLSLSTRAVHAGEIRPRINGAVTLPIFQSSMYETAGEERYEDIKYIRCSNTPNHEAVTRKLAALEEGESAIVLSSGMAAISNTILALLCAGDHLLVQESLYGGVPSFLDHEARRLGIEYSTIDPLDRDSWGSRLRTNTRAIYVETLSNPLLVVPELDAVPVFAREHGLISIVDNTFATPVNFSPPRWGFDLSVHSCTKFINGHSDLSAGAVIGRADLVRRVRETLIHGGACLNPFACYLLHRALKTLHLRIERQNTNAAKLARFLRGHAGVQRVHYPGLREDRNFERAQRFLRGAGGVLSFELVGTPDNVGKLFSRLRLPVVAPSLGGVETSITRPALTSHICIPPADRLRMGVSDQLIRLSVGVEEAEDLIADFSEALDNL
jgi:cystathionine beta-lyase/cystathionine gamma-synthase